MEGCMSVLEAPGVERRRLGEILVELGHVTPQQLDEALVAQRARGGRLGEVLLESHTVRAEQLIEALALQFGLDYVDLDTADIDPELLTLLPSTLARRHRSVPVRRDGQSVIVAMANPADVFAIDDLRTALRADVRPALADPGQIAEVLGRLGQGSHDLERVVRLAVGETSSLDDDIQVAEAVRLIDRDDSGSHVVRFVDLIIGRAVAERASDIHIEPTEHDLRIRIRVDGMLREVMSVPKPLQSALVSRIKVMAEIDIAERRLPQDGRATVQTGDDRFDLRVATVPTVHGEAVVLRLLQRNGRQQTMADLGMLPEVSRRFEHVVQQPWGVVLVAGPTGSGKTTTLYSALRGLNEIHRNILTIEDPVEYRLDGIKQVQVNNKAGLTFASALRNFLRADPDVILVGEVRDGETAEIATESALTGHLVLSTIHTNNAASTPIRLVELGVEPFLVTSSLRGVLSQRLVRRLCERCREETVLSPADATELGVPDELRRPDGGFTTWNPVGCSACSRSGFRGRFSVQELLVMTDPIAELIQANAPSSVIGRQATADGMVPIWQDGLRKVAAGWSSVEELRRTLG
jgi:type IV pilus assembly protein PilB